ncbi:MAG: YncE family protein [Verrucomicrobiales bacterium]|nr:YncE family protein [Verrucomicrobiales bacterium]
MIKLAISLLCIAALNLPAQEAGSLKLIRTIMLPGIKGRFDHFGVDVKGNRVFVAALGNNSVEVIDTAEGTHIKSIGSLHKPTGIVHLREMNRLAVANGDDGTLKTFDSKSYTLVNSLSSLDDADNIRFDPKRKLIYAGYGSGSLALVDSVTMKQRTSIKLAAHPESFQLEKEGDRIFVNVPDAKRITVIDRQTQKVIAEWPMNKYQGNFPMALDESNNRLFVGCRNPATLVVIDTSNGRVVSDIPIHGDTDDLFHDSRLKRIYISCGEGFIDVVEQKTPDAYNLRDRVTTRAGARTSFFCPETNEFYLAVPMRDKASAELRVFSPRN